MLLKLFVIAAIFLCNLTIIFAQTTNEADMRPPYPLTFTGSLPTYTPIPTTATINQVITQNVLIPGVLTPASVDGLFISFGDKAVTTQFLDGLGRPIQMINHEASSNFEDVVQAIVYDKFDRNPKQYLPFPDPNVGSGFRFDALTDQAKYYALYDGHQTEFPYKETVFENSPLNRAERQSFEGESWSLASGNTVKKINRTNAFGEVNYYYFSFGNILYSTGCYEPQTLFVEETIDEHGKRVTIFTDKAGKTVLKRAEDRDTYYAYDVLGRMRGVLSPLMSEYAIATSPLTSLLHNLGYYYEFDAYGRLVTKYINQTKFEYVFDKRNRLVLERSAAQEAKKEWTFHKYDQLNRKVITGLYRRTDSVSRVDMQNAVEAFPTPYIELYEEKNDNLYPATAYGYTTNRTFPNISLEVLTVQHYDDYGYINTTYLMCPDCPKPANVPWFSSAPKAYSTRGLPTYQRIHDGVDNTLKNTYSFYDRNFRVAEIKSYTRLGLNVTTNEYDFAGRVLKEARYNNAGYIISGFYPVLSYENRLLTSFIYNGFGKLSLMKHELRRLNSATPPFSYFTKEFESTFEYDDLGKLKRKNLHKEFGDPDFLQKLDYKYNIRGWMTHINDAALSHPTDNDLFGMELYYDQGYTIPQFNGNISGIKWSTATDRIQRTFGFQYDDASRLIQADYRALDPTLGTFTNEGDQFSLSGITYDRNGNILTLNRNGLESIDMSDPLNPVKIFNKIDRLTYFYGDITSYRTNRLLAVDDAITSQNAAMDFCDNGNIYGYYDPWNPEEYYYDENQNLIKDVNKGISVDYNHQNLPTHIGMSGGEIYNYYDALGNKTREEVYTGSVLTRRTDYIEGFIYEDGKLKGFPFSEGRIVHDELSPEPLFPEYHLKDHLGNMRVAVRSAKPRYFITAEPERDSIESLIFPNIDTYRTNLTAHQGTNSIRANVHEEISFPVVAGEKLKLSVWALAQCGGGISTKTGDPNTHTSAAPVDKTWISLQDLVTPALSVGSVATPQGDGQKVQAQQLQFNVLSLVPLIKKIFGGVQKARKVVPDTLSGPPAPMIHVRLTMIASLYDSTGLLIDSWTKEVRTQDFYTWQELLLNIDVPSSGTLKISFTAADFYLCSSVVGFFDDFSVRGMKAEIFQENHFDPFGLNLKGIEEIDLQTQQTTPEFRYQYNGKEKTEDLGLMWNSHDARSLDLQLGRWWSLDPLAETDASFSPFCFAFNNPIKHNDPDGKWPIETIWDAANVLYDVGAIIYHAATGDLESAKSAAVDLMADGGAMLIPYVPAGASKSKYVLSAFGAGGKKSKEVVEVLTTVETRKEAINQAKKIAKTPRKSKGGEDISIDELKISSRGKNWEAMKAKGAKKLGAKNPKGNNQWMEHPDGHPDAGGADIPEYHNGGHVHVVDIKGNEKVIPYVETKTKKK